MPRPLSDAGDHELEADADSVIPAWTENGHALLVEAWDAYEEYDHNANRLQRRFRRLQAAILFTGVLVVLVVAIQSQVGVAALQLDAELARPDAPADPATLAHLHRLRGAAAVLYWIVFALPLILSALIAAAHSFRPGDKWVVLRGSAEAVKRQIFRFRTGTGEYSPGEPTVEHRLFAQLSAINERLKQSDVSKSALARSPAPSRAKADRMTPLDAGQYLKQRVDDQLGFFSNRTVRFDRQISWATIAILVFGAIGALMAAGNLPWWVPVATTIAAAFTTHLRYTQSEETLITYNRTRMDLRNIRVWWKKLTPAEQQDRQNFSLLVDLTEKALEDETAGWSQRMTDALADLSRKAADQENAEE